jgi:hypothetical protein
MVKPLIFLGALVLAVGVGALVMFVVPHVGATTTPALDGIAGNAIPPLAVFIAAMGLAVGAAMIGIGVGRWQHPRAAEPRHGDHGAEI